MPTNFRVSKDKPKVTHLPSGMIWEFRQTPGGYWDGQVINMDKCPSLPVDSLARLNRMAGEAFMEGWKL